MVAKGSGIKFMYRGRWCTVPTLAKIAGTTNSTMYSRLLRYGIPVEEAVEIPVRPIGKRYKMSNHCHSAVITLFQIAETAGLSISTMAKKTGYHPRTISRWRRGNSPVLRDLSDLLDLLGYDLVALPKERGGVRRRDEVKREAALSQLMCWNEGMREVKRLY